jgi:hypothetical protein
VLLAFEDFEDRLDAPRIVWQPPPDPARLAVALDPATVALARRVTVRFRSTLPATAHVVVKRGNRVIAEAQAEAVPGDNALTVPERLKGGAVHRVTLTLNTPDGKVATAQTPYLPRGPLPVSLARRLTRDLAQANSEEAFSESLQSCRRMTQRRVDCQTSSSFEDVPRSCNRILAFFLPANGRMNYRAYRCPYTRRPRFGPKQPVPPF